ncbi:MAG: hypothetical protein Q8L54_13750 [Devosia sp.]|nr:hypothetical protein [Devosia sp.]
MVGRIVPATTDANRSEVAAALAYKGRLLARFANARLPRQTAQIATDASRKVPQRRLAPLRERLGAGHLPEAVSFAVAAWIRSCGGMDDDGIAFSVNDPLLEGWSGRPDQRAATPAETVAAFLSFSAVFGSGLGANAAVGGAIERALAAIAGRGVLAALAARGWNASRNTHQFAEDRPKWNKHGAGSEKTTPSPSIASGRPGRPAS